MPEAIEVTDFDIKDGINSYFRSAIKCCSYFYHISYLESCKFVDVCPGGLIINKSPFISFSSHELTAIWEDTISSTQSQLLDTLIIGIHGKLMDFEQNFWEKLSVIEEDIDLEKYKDWLVKLIVYLEKEEIRIVKRKKEEVTEVVDK